VANQSLKATESWDLKGAMTETLGGCNLWHACGGKGKSTIPILHQKTAASIDELESLVSAEEKIFYCCEKMCIYTCFSLEHSAHMSSNQT
jgi:hypothetical protein